MILAIDVQYNGTRAYAGAILFETWDANTSTAYSAYCPNVQEYESGEFYKRELPCLLKLIAPLMEEEKIDTIVIDGYVDLGEGVPGLGRHLFHSLGEKVEVVGVAKTAYRDAPCVEVIRGNSKKPLLVTSTGDVHKAAASVKDMFGPHRLPLLLQRADHMARGLL